ncbi:MAG: efflux RND transporter periplasmic adaptor subunit [Sedimentisphaerales bacterium]|nr:efflux RND transporter periplasmic adaptor subunit [Sedimentisphaerales bacterium]
MLETIRRNNHSLMQKANHFGMALFVFVVLTATALWLTGNLRFGPPARAEYDGAVTGPNTHEHECRTDEGVCEEHTVPESLCARCDPELTAAFRAKGDWCAEHNLPESQCTVCDPNLMSSFASRITGTSGLSALEEAMCEHRIRTVECDSCRFELGIVQVQPPVANALIETAVVRNMERTETLKLTGQVQLDKTTVVDVVPAGGGQVKRVEKLLGQEVNEGDLLAVIHSADLGQAKAQFLEVQARLELANSTFEREKDLLEKKVSSKADFLIASSELKAAQACYAAAERRLRLFGLESEQIEACKSEKDNSHFAEFLLHAPKSGTIIAQNISAGALVDSTQSLFTIADLSNVWIWCDLYERDLAALRERLSSGQKVAAKLKTKAFEAQVFDGTVDLIGTQVDEHTRTIKVRIQVENKERKLKPGMFAEAEIAIPLNARATVVPSTAVLSDEGRSFLFQQWKNDFWVRRDVRVGRRLGNFVEILQGVPAGATVVARGAFMLKSDILREKMGAGCAD